jgi:Ca2+-binding RTX toxin-like protein
MAVKLNQHDLQFILTQIKIAEAHSAGTPLNQLITAPHLPYGLRTVDGSYNNIIPGRELWGAADQTMPRMFDPYWRNDGDGDTMPFGPPGAPVVTNNDYGVDGVPTPSPMMNGGHSGNVADADPRIISNLIVDQTPNNPAAVIAALQHAGFEGSSAELNQAVLDISTPYALIRAAEIANHRVASWQNTIANLEDAIEALDPAAPDYAARLGQLSGVLSGAQGALAGAQGAAIAPNAAAIGQQAALDAAVAEYGIAFEVDGKSLQLPNVAPDEGLSAPFNGWMTFFGQFFDHGLDLIAKGGEGTIYVPLQPDDPLYVEGGFTNFMVLTRATQFNGPGPDGVLGTGDDTSREQINTTTPFVDQNQTYTSHPSHQVYLREYALVDGKPMATGRMLDGAHGGLPTWADVKAQARDLLGIELTDRDVFNIPLVRTDLYGEFIRDANGFPQVIIGIGPDGIPNTADDAVMSGTPASPVQLDPNNGGIEPVRTSHAFLDDIAHNAVPVLDTEGVLRPDNIDVPTDPAGNAVQFDPLTGDNLEYDNELLDRHFITGDGRGNENIGLTAVHHVFHSEHNRQVEVQKLEILKSGDAAFINEWLLTDLTEQDVAALPTGSAALAAIAGGLSWDGERLFQAARFATEMQYQHLVFEEFGRKVQPMIDLFVFNTITDIDPAIFSEFANVVYRFGHSMLTEDIGRMFLNEAGEPVSYSRDANGNLVETPVGDLTTWGNDIGLIEAFLNPVEFDQDGQIDHDQAAGAIFRGMTRIQGNEIDEFIVDALRNNLLGLPLDLAAINIARGRDTGMPTLNQAREQLYAATNSTFVKPYSSWTDFAANLKTPASIINFIAAYGTHSLIEAAGDDVDARRAAATLLVLGGTGEPADRIDFLNGIGTWADEETGLGLIDLWIGGLAEKKMPFGGFLGSTFNAVFEAQLEMLQDLDRFYYLTRTQGLNLLNELENNAFSKMIMANTDMTLPGPDGVRGTEDDIVNYHVGVDSFAKHDHVLHVDPTKQIGADPTHENQALNALGLTKVQRDNLATIGPDQNYIRFVGGEHVVIGGTEGDDTIIADYGDDAIWGGGGNDRIEGGAGVDLIIGGSGDDIITDSGDTGDFIKGEDGDDVIANANGLDILMGGDGKDVFLVGVDATEVFAGEGDDFVLGGADADFILGNEGDDWIEGGDGFDVLNGDNSELFFNSTIIGHDVLIAGENENDFDAESGDDIMVQGESVMRNEGMLGFDWAIHKGSRIAADSDMRIPIFTNVAADILRDRFDQTEGLSGWKHNDVLRGDDRGDTSELEPELDMAGHQLDQAGIDRIAGLRELLNLAARGNAADGDLAWTGGNILLGGDGHDTIEGRGGNDFIDGDAWLNVRIRLTALGGPNTPAGEISTVDTLKHVFTAADVNITANPQTAAWVGKSLAELLLQGVIKPSQLHIVREILHADGSDDTDTAVYAGAMDLYEITQVGNRTIVARREQEEIDPHTDEGTDILVNIERIQFADQILTLRTTGNFDPVGVLRINGLPAIEDGLLTVDASQVTDANYPGGVIPEGAISYQWQVERNDGTGDFVDIPGAQGNTFRPGDAESGLGLRVRGTFVDGGQVREYVFSATTAPVVAINDAPSGELLISDNTPTQGEQLMATVAFVDPDGMSDAFEEGLLTYTWERSLNGTTWTIAQAASATSNYTPTAGDVGYQLRVRIDYTDDAAKAEFFYSAATSVVGRVLNGTNGNNSGAGALTGTAGDDIINGLNGNDVLNGGAGNDRLNGGSGTDTLNGDAGNDILNGNADADILNGGDGDDILVHNDGEGADTFNGGAGQDTVYYTGDNDGDTLNVTFDGTRITQLEGGALTGIEAVVADADDLNADFQSVGADEDGDRLVYTTAAAAGVSVNLLTGAASGFAFIRNFEDVDGTQNADTLIGNNEANELNGLGGADTLRGGAGNDDLNGGDGDDKLFGDAGNDVLNGQVGADEMWGGNGNDTFVVNIASDIVVESADQGTDTVRTMLAAYTAGNHVENITYVNSANNGAGTAAFTGTGNGLDNVITGGTNNDTLTGNDGNDTLLGGAGNDTLIGGAGNDILDGGTGNDSMTGGIGNDTYYVDDVTNPADTIIENAGEGSDTVISTQSYTLGANLENLRASGGGNNRTFSGNAEANIIIGGSGNDTLNGLDNDDRLQGLAGNDSLNGGNGTDTAVFSNALASASFGLSGNNLTVDAGEGTDTLNSVERLQFGDHLVDVHFSSSASPVTLNGSAGSDLFVGTVGSGTRTMNGGDGDDHYFINGNDTVAEASATGGTDSVYMASSMQTYTLGNNVENLTALGNYDPAGGGDQTTLLIGNSLANIISGGGNDVMRGLGGNDTYIVNNTGDSIDETAAGSGGIDKVLSSVSHTLSANVEDLELTGTGNISADGNSGNNVLTGNAGNNVLDGNGGTDTAVFANAATDYRFDLNQADPLVIGLAGGGTDELEEIDLVRFAGIDHALVNGGNGGGTSNGGTGADLILGHDGADTLNGNAGADILVGGDGNDILNGGAGNDLFIWDGANGNSGDDLDSVSGGADTDTFHINGSNAGETFRIYTALEYAEALDVAAPAGFDIFITRVVGNGDETLIAQLTGIEEISINARGGTDTFEVFGDFTGTSLSMSTITIEGSSDDDIVDISALQSAHRIVFKSRGGDDVIIGTVRPQDVIELAVGKTIADYETVANPDGTTTITTQGHSVTFTGSGGMPQFGETDDDDDDDDDDHGNGNEPPANEDDDHQPGNDDDDDDGADDDDDGPSAPPPTAGAITGTSNGDILTGTAGGDLIFGMAGTDYIVAGSGADVIRADEGNDFIYAEAGRDVVFGGEGDDDIFGGADDDMLYGEDGNDWVSGEDGNDLIDAGNGHDEVFGGQGHDRFIGRANDGNDTYDGGEGRDSLDLGSLTGAVQVDLGNGVGGRGSVTGQAGTDTLYNIENVTTGAGADVIRASNAVNVIDGGAGNDVFVFASGAAAQGDTIRNFETGDKIDLSGIDANSGMAGNQAFTLVSGQSATAPAQIVVTYETRDDGDYTVISGNIGNGNDPEFRLELTGNRVLTASDFNL